MSLLFFVATKGLNTYDHGTISVFDFKRQTPGVHQLDIVGDFDTDKFSPRLLNIWKDARRSKLSSTVENCLSNCKLCESEVTQPLYK